MRKEDIVITWEALPEDCTVRGNAGASGDDAFDKETEDRIIEDLKNGNEWAWCTVKCTAEHLPSGLTGCDYLGCCSYSSFKDFMEGGYAEQMEEAARTDLRMEIDRMKAALKE